MNDLEKAIQENIEKRAKLNDQLLENASKQMALLEEEVELTEKLLKVYKNKV